VGQYFDMDPTLVRLLFVLGVFLGFGGAVPVYLIMMFVVPEEPLGNPEATLSTPAEQSPNESEPPVS
jgi:phage shock protein PspC (stress-responsive transcriptional regulator)